MLKFLQLLDISSTCRCSVVEVFLKVLLHPSQHFAVVMPCALAPEQGSATGILSYVHFGAPGVEHAQTFANVRYSLLNASSGSFL